MLFDEILSAKSSHLDISLCPAPLAGHNFQMFDVPQINSILNKLAIFTKDLSGQQQYYHSWSTLNFSTA